MQASWQGLRLREWSFQEKPWESVFIVFITHREVWGWLAEGTDVRQWTVVGG